MRLRVLGAHNLESLHTRCVSLLINDVIALDAGSITSSLTFEQQARLKVVFLSHSHYDHVKDVPALALNLFRQSASVCILCSAEVRATMVECMLNGDLYPRLHERPAAAPTIRFREAVAGTEESVGHHRLRPLPVAHAKETLGVEVSDQSGTTLLYTADTGPLPEGFWAETSPRMLVIETTAPSRYAEMVQPAGHLTPSMLEVELVRFRAANGFVPRVLTVHADPLIGTRQELCDELAAVSARTGADIQVAYEGLELDI